MNFWQVFLKVNSQPKIAIYSSNQQLIFKIRILVLAIMLWVCESRNAIAQSADYGDAPSSYRDTSHDLNTSPQLYLGKLAPILLV